MEVTGDGNSKTVSQSWRVTYSLRRWQQEAFENWCENQKGIAGVVTGAGKTVLAFQCALSFMRHHESGRIIIVVPSLSLLDQWVVALQEELGVRREHIGVYSGEEKSESPRVVNVLVINTARTKARDLSEGCASLLIVDECHRAATPENSKALEGDHQATLGLSATPERQYDDGLVLYLKPVLGPIIYRYNYADAASDGIIAPFRLINVRIPLSSYESAAYEKYNRAVGAAYAEMSKGKDSEAKYKTLLRKRAEVSTLANARIPVAVNLAERYRDARMMIFHERVSAANVIWRLLDGRGHSITRYHSDIAPDIRRSNLQLFRRGYMKGIVACRALDEGVNVPDASVAILSASTSSRRQRVQRLGRVLRPGAKGEAAVVFTLYATEAEETRLVKEARMLENTAEVRWRKASLDGAG